MRSVGVLTLGCKVNTYESEYITHLLKEHGYQIKSFDDVCDVYIINTCTVTNTSDVKSRKMIRQAIKRNPDACVVAAGCFIEANKDYTIPGLDIVIGNKDKSKIVELLEEYFTKKQEIRRLYKELPREFEDMYINEFPGRTRAFVKIQDGCENFCSYCIIPFVRGKCRSKDPDTVIKENPVIVNHLHIPLQAGSNHVLRMMNRKYDLKYFKFRIQKIRKIRPDIAISTDVIVGFPGETGPDFSQTLETCEELQFTKIHVFPYSERKGTVAKDLPYQVDKEVRRTRARMLLALSKKLETNYFNTFIGKDVSVLIEEEKDGKSYGHTDNYLHVEIDKILPKNTFVTARITEVCYPYCIGEVSLLK